MNSSQVTISWKQFGGQKRFGHLSGISRARSTVCFLFIHSEIRRCVQFLCLNVFHVIVLSNFLLLLLVYNIIVLS